jgi:hypothetical protein
VGRLASKTASLYSTALAIKEATLYQLGYRKESLLLQQRARVQIAKSLSG